MALLVWFTVGIALWHFTVFVPDRFWGGIVGAFLGAIAGAHDHRRDRPDRVRAQASGTPTSSPCWSRSPGR